MQNMNLITKRFNISVRFFTVCGLLIVMAISMMMRYMYPDDTEPQYETQPTVESITSTEETTLNTSVSSSTNGTTVSIDEEENTDVDNEEAKVVLLSDSRSESMSCGTSDEDISDTSETQVTEPIEEKVLTYKYGRRITPAVDIEIPTGNDMRNYTGEVDTSGYEYIGNYHITGYTPKCVHCCGNDKGITASGVEAIAGYTIATNSNIPFGTTLYIEGYGYYVAEDRGLFSSWVIDIAAPSHDVCYELTNPDVRVYIVPHEENN